MADTIIINNLRWQTDQLPCCHTRRVFDRGRARQRLWSRWPRSRAGRWIRWWFGIYIIFILYYYLLYLAFGKIKGAAEFSMIIVIFGIRYHQRARRIWWSHCWSWWRWSSKSKHNIWIIKKFVERFPPKHVNSVKLPPDNDVEMQVSRDEGAWVQRESVIDEAVGEEQVVPVKQLSYNLHVKWPFVNYLWLKQTFIFGL